MLVEALTPDVFCALVSEQLQDQAIAREAESKASLVLAAFAALRREPSLPFPATRSIELHHGSRLNTLGTLIPHQNAEALQSLADRAAWNHLGRAFSYHHPD